MADLHALDREISEVAEASAFVLDAKFEEMEGRALERLLADYGWPAHVGGRSWSYAIKGDNSNAALRRLQRKYHAALIAVAAAREGQERSR